MTHFDLSSVLLHCNQKPYRDSRWPQGGDRPTGLQLASGHYQSKTALSLVYPRPDAETSTKARHRVNYTGQLYEIPIVAFGGNWPYNITLTTFPAGMTIGQSLVLSGGRYVRNANTHIITWLTPTAGTHTIAGTITDQAGDTVNFSYTLVVGTAGWKFVDVNAGTNGSGTLASPYNTLASLTSGDPVILRGGTYDLNQKTVPLDQMAPTWLPYTGETVVLQQALSSVGNNPGTGNFWFSDFTFNAPVARNGVNQLFRFEGANRTVFFRNKFNYANVAYTASGGTENVSVVMWTNQSLVEANVGNGWYNVFHSNSFKDITDRDMMLGYSLRFCVFENNSMENCTVGANNFGHGFYFKMNCSDIEFRGNYSIGITNTQKLKRVDAYNDQYPVNRIYELYNSYRYYGTDEGASGYCHEFVTSGSARFSFRNSYYAHTTASFYMRGMSAGDTVTLENNVMVSGGTNTNGVRLDQFDGTLVNNNYVAGAPAANIMDSSNYLLGSYATSYLGIRGAEVF